ncbi:uncharacterized protein [Halyomorpha halys]|uniref:uncharacterized protein isoform X2 n=1 Tax=Halyomorpha halys TaxID=286706 RepID=UPI0006D51498|nr:uncharacterized protein LOC106683755 [Halyomorpha halys]
MNSSIAFLLIVLNLLAGSADARAKMKKYIWLQEVTPCAVDKSYTQINGSFRYTGKGTFYLSLDMYSPKDIEHMYFFLDLKKCPTKSKTDDCEVLMSFPVGDQCNTQDAFFRYFYSQFEPPIVCPLKDKHYQAKNVIFDPELFSTFFRGLGDEEWLHVSINGYPDEKRAGKMEMCLGIIATMKKIRIEDKTGRKRNQ